MCHSLCLTLGTTTTSDERPSETSPTDQAPNNLNTPSSTSVSSPSQPHSTTSLNRQSTTTQSIAPSKPLSVVSEPPGQTRVSPQPHVTMPPVAPREEMSSRKDEEPNMEHFAKAAENLVASLDDEEDEEEVIL